MSRSGLGCGGDVAYAGLNPVDGVKWKSLASESKLQSGARDFHSLSVPWGVLLHCTGLYRCSKHFLIRAGDADPILRRHVNPFLAILAVIDLIRRHPG